MFNILRPPSVDVVGIKPVRNPSRLLFGNVETGMLQQNPTNPSIGITNNKDRVNAFNVFEVTDIFRQYRLSEAVKYVLNPAAGVKVEMIDACLVIEYKGDKSLKINPSYADGIENNQSFPFYPGILDNKLTFDERLEQIEQTGLDFEYMSSTLDVLRFRTKYVSLSCLQNQSFVLFAGKLPTVYIKMLVKTRRKDNPNSELITQILTFDISSSFINPNISPTDCRIDPEIGIMCDEIFDLGGKEVSLPVTGGIARFRAIQLTHTQSFADILRV